MEDQSKLAKLNIGVIDNNDSLQFDPNEHEDMKH